MYCFTSWWYWKLIDIVLNKKFIEKENVLLILVSNIKWPIHAGNSAENKLFESGLWKSF